MSGNIQPFNSDGGFSTTGNITGNYLIGNGSQLTGLSASYGNSNVANFMANYGSNTISLSGTITSGNTYINGLISTTGNITTANVIGDSFYANGLISASGNVDAREFHGNLFGGDISNITITPDYHFQFNVGNVANVIYVNDGGMIVDGGVNGFISASGNISGANVNANGTITGGNIHTNGKVSAAGAIFGANAVITDAVNANTVGANIFTGGVISMGGNIESNTWVTARFMGSTGNIRIYQGNLIVQTGYVSAVGNVYGNYFIGDGSQLTGITANYSNSNVATFLAAFGSNTISTTGNITGGNILASGYASVTGNITGGNLRTAGLVSATGNIVTAGNFVGNGAALTNVTVSVAGNIVGTQSNVNLVAGSYTYTFDNTGNVTLPSGGDLVFSGNTTLTSVGGTNGNITVNPDGTGQFVVTNITPTYLGNTVSIVGNTTGSNISASGQISAVGTITSNGNTNATAFAVVGNGAVSNVALGFFPTGNTPAEMAIRDYSTANSSIYFDTTIGSANIGGQFQFRGSNAYTQYAVINRFGVTLPTRPAFRVWGNTGNVTLFNSGSTVANTVVDYNQGSYYVNSTGIFTAPVAGLYTIFLNARAGTTASLSQIGVFKNGNTSGGANTLCFWEITTSATQTTHFGVSTVANLAVGDTIQAKVVSGSVTFDSNDNWGAAYIG